jgi:hypothetical protein
MGGSMRASNFHLFVSLEKHLAVKLFVTDANMKQAVTSWLQTSDISFFSCWDTSFGVMVGQIFKCKQ